MITSPFFKRVSPPSAAHEEIRAAQLAIPLRHFAGLILHFHVNPGVGIDPLQLDERALELHGLFGVELRREGVMRECRRGDQRGDQTATWPASKDSYYLFPTMCCGSIFFSQTNSSRSVSGSSVYRITGMIHGFV